MKKTLLLISILAGLNAFAQDQNSEGEESYAGSLMDFQSIRIGLNLGTQFVSPEFQDLKATPRIGFHYISVIEIPVSDKSSILYEAGISTEGAIYEDADNIYKSRMTNIPVSLQYNFFSGNGITFSLGPQYSYMLGGKFLEEDKNDETVTKYKASKVVTRGNWSGVAELGYQLKNGPMVSVRYIHGIKNINNKPNNISFFDADQEVYNRTFQVSLRMFLYGDSEE